MDEEGKGWFSAGLSRHAIILAFIETSPKTITADMDGYKILERTDIG